MSGSDPALAEIGTRVDELRYLAADVAADLGSYLADADIDPARLEQVEQRRAALGDLTRLYGPTVDDVLALGRARPPRRVTELDGTGDRIGELERARRRPDRRARATAAARLTAAAHAPPRPPSARRITDELSHLAMGSATVVGRRRGLPAGSRTDGRDDIEIRLAVRLRHRAAGGDQGGIRR